MAGAFRTSFWTPEVIVCVFVTPRKSEAAASAVIGSAFWEWQLNNGHHPSDRTHVKDPKDLVQIQLPGGNPSFAWKL